MSTTPIQLIKTQNLQGTVQKYYTVPQNTSVIVTKITLTNTSNVAELVDIYFVPSGDTTGLSNLILRRKAIEIEETFPVYQLEGQILQEGDEIHAKADQANSVLIMASGVKVV